MSTSRNPPTLADIMKGSESRWHRGLVVDRYRRILRDILDQISDYEGTTVSVDLETTSIHIEGNRAILGDDQPFYRSPRILFKPLLNKVLGKGSNPEIRSFIKLIDHRFPLKHLCNHPLLQLPCTRFYLSARVFVHLDNDWEYDGWKDRYNKCYPGRSGIKEIIEESKLPLLQSVFDHNAYPDTHFAIVEFSKNFSHLKAEHNRRLGGIYSVKEDELERQLTALFPERLVHLFEFLVTERVDLSFLGSTSR